MKTSRATDLFTLLLMCGSCNVVQEAGRNFFAALLFFGVANGNAWNLIRSVEKSGWV